MKYKINKTNVNKQNFKMDSSCPNFFIKSQNNQFLNKQKDIFALLADAEKTVDLKKNKINDNSERLSRKESKQLTKQYKGQNSLFKRPFAPPLKVTNIPDFKRNPGRWTKYSLADVSPNDMTESSNTNAAFEFLNSLKGKKQDEESDDDKGPIVFNNVIKRKSVGFGDSCEPIEEDPPPDLPQIKQSKVIMPEYVVGAKIKKPKKSKRTLVQLSSTTLVLNHLHDIEDE